MLVDGFGVFDIGGVFQVRQPERMRLAAPDIARLAVEQVDVAVVHLGHLRGHRAVEEDLPAVEVPAVPVAREPVQDLLGAADREGRDQQVAAVGPGVFEHLADLGDGGGAVTVGEGLEGRGTTLTLHLPLRAQPRADDD